jgi:Cu(I)/Ag(I) efflux system membrane fusion protein
MSRFILVGVAAVAMLATAGRGLSGEGEHRHDTHAASTAIAAQPEPSAEAPIYYQHPDGKPIYSPTPKTTPDGRAFRAVPPGADLSFEDDPTTAPAPASVAAIDRKIKFYRNPMGLADTSPVPKKDSMGMDYIPVYADEDLDDGAIKLSPGKIQRSGVQSERVASRAIRSSIRAPGVIQLDERRVSVIAMRSESWIKTIADVTTGSRVTKGQPLMQVYSATVAAAAADFVSTINSKTTGGIVAFGRGSRQKLINLDVPETAIAAMEKTGTAPVMIDWVAPRDGIVLERNAIEGMRAQPGDVLFRVADLSEVWALVDVAERDLGALAIGQRVSVRPRAYPQREFAGTVAVIYPLFGRDTRTARLRVALANPDAMLLPEMYVDATIEAGNPKPVLAAPESAVLDSGERQIVLIAKGDGRFEPRAVKLGARGGGYVELREGVSEGDAVVVSATFLIDAESNLKAALKSLSDAGSKP